MGRNIFKDELPCICGKGTVLVETTENDHSYLKASNSWERREVIRACSACGLRQWREPTEPTEAELKAEKAEVDAAWDRAIENANAIKKPK